MSIYVAKTAVIALTGATTQTLLQVAASSSKSLRIKEIGVSFDGVDAAKTPIQVDLLRQTTAGTSGVSVTVVGQTGAQETPLATAGSAYSAEPTGGDVLRSWYIPPAGGLWVVQFPLGDEPWVAVSGRIGLRAITAAAVSPNTLAYLVFEE